MALKDLPPSAILNFKILLDQLPTYVYNLAIKSAGVDKNKFASSLSTTQKTGRPVAIQMQELYSSLQGIASTASATATFDKTYKDTATWANNFFIIRTQIVGVAPQDPILLRFDELWTSLQSITGKWKMKPGKY